MTNNEGQKGPLRGPIIRIETPALKMAEEKVEQVTGDFTQGGFQVLDQLAEEVGSMKLASRFNTTGKIKDNPYHILDAPPVPSSKLDLSEAKFKRDQLQTDVETVRQELRRLAAKLGRLVMDIEASKEED